MRPLRNFKTNQCCHLISRIANRAFFLNDEEKTRFVERLWRVATFSSVEVLAYCFMSNHFHILVYVPDPRELSDDELLARIRALYAGTALAKIEKEWELLTKVGGLNGRRRFRKRYLRRMWSASEFMKTLKQTATMSYNGRSVHTGTIWESRFRAKTCGPDEKAELMNMAGYIDRNPVKAKMVRWPDEYEWCSFAAAARGDARCVDGYRFIYSVFAPLTWERIREMHEKSIHLVLKELEDERLAGRAKKGLSVDDEKQQKARRRDVSRFEQNKTERVPHILEKGSDKVAYDILKRLADGPRRPAELRAALGIASANFFTARYLTPLAKSGYIAVAGGEKNRYLPGKQYRILRKGKAVVCA